MCIDVSRDPSPPDEPSFPVPLPPRPPVQADPAKALAAKDAQRRWILQYAQDQPSSGDEGAEVRARFCSGLLGRVCAA